MAYTQRVSFPDTAFYTDTFPELKQACRAQRVPQLSFGTRAHKHRLICEWVLSK